MRGLNCLIYSSSLKFTISLHQSLYSSASPQLSQANRDLGSSELFHQHTAIMSTLHNILETVNQDFILQDLGNEPATGISSYTPAQFPPAGTASDPQPNGSHPPKLFQPLKLRGLTLQNLIMLSPSMPILCGASSSNRLAFCASEWYHPAWSWAFNG